ncbi:MAG TPA: GNAT family N-acetyltransferase [Anaerolineaceae bacterium]|nr:GNAT family N-acetyltransferase [Anaerolineaceae bacterium]
MFPSLPPVIIRQATSQDIPAVTRFMDQALLVHRNLDWQPLMDWITKEPFLLRYEGNKLTSLMSCASDPPGVAWIHAYAMDRWSTEMEKSWRSLLEPALAIINQEDSRLYSVALHDWFKNLLISAGFSIIQHIVVLIWNQSLPQILPVPRTVNFRPMTLSDLDSVVAIDHLAFDPLWRISQDSMKCAFLSSAHSSVAEIDDTIVGYELSTASHFTAHLTRLAVHPDYKLANIGYSLVRLMLEYFQRFQINQITVNTQQNNSASIGLYKKLGFTLTDDSFPIYQYGITG